MILQNDRKLNVYKLEEKPNPFRQTRKICGIILKMRSQEETKACPEFLFNPRIG